MKQKTIDSRKEFSKNVENEFRNMLKDMDISDIENNISYLNNIGDSLKMIVTDQIENRFLDQIVNPKLREVIRTGLIESDLYDRYEFMNDNIYLNIVKEISDAYIDVGISAINEFSDSFFEGVSNEDIEYCECSPLLEIHLKINYLDDNKTIDYKNPVTFYGDRLISNDDSINPSDSIMIWIFI